MPAALRVQAQACAGLGSPFMARLLTGLADTWPEHGPVGQLCAKWPGDLGPGGASLPLRLAGGLHALVQQGADPDLAAAYPPNVVSDAVLTRTVLAAIQRNAAFLTDWMQNAPQTNEVRRSAVLIAVAHWLARQYPLPFVLSELGASAGLNLNWDRFALQAAGQRLGPPDAVLTLTPDWTGPVPAAAAVTVADRAGVDLNPLDPQNAAHAQRLYSYLWPDQPHRIDLTRAAIAVQNTPVARDDAVDWLANRLSQPRPGHLHLIYHTVAWQYFPPERQETGARLIAEAGQRATETAPLAWLAMETDGDTAGAALTLRLWPGNLTIPLGRADFHGRWVNWQAPERPFP